MRTILMYDQWKNEVRFLPEVLRNRWIHVCCLALVVGLVGCGGGAYQSAPVNAEKARETLKTAMESWKSGEPAELMQDQSPSIVVQDFDWLSGAKLVSYEILGDEKEVNANLVAKVKLNLKDKQGAVTEKTVTYLVGTAPTLTVFRDSFQ
jgi:hypothetical protein